MTKFEEVLVRVAYVAKLLIGVAGMIAVALLGMDGIPEAWQFPLQAVATVAAAVALFKVPNGSSLADRRKDEELTRLIGEAFKKRSGGDIE